MEDHTYFKIYIFSVVNYIVRHKLSHKKYKTFLDFQALGIEVGTPLTIYLISFIKDLQNMVIHMKLR